MPWSACRAAVRRPRKASALDCSMAISVAKCKGVAQTAKKRQRKNLKNNFPKPLRAWMHEVFVHGAITYIETPSAERYEANTPDSDPTMLG